uniref:Choline O-acetyltransferase n=1 Tax=Angiostrongylus cantonensis TaxID=6313 RepID=A0A0K0CTB1_ANGCA
NPDTGHHQDEQFQRALLKPPVPSLDHCLDRYSEYVEVVADGQNRPTENTLRAVQDFRQSGLVFQKRLLSIAEQEPNWVKLVVPLSLWKKSNYKRKLISFQINQFWLPEMYLRVRLPLPVNVNPAYIFPLQHFKDEEDWLSYTALLVRGFVEYKNKIDTKQIEREMSTGKLKVNLCMQQYDSILSCYRHPGIEEDVQVVKPKRNKGNEHILVMCGNQGFIVQTRTDGTMLPFADVLYQLRQVLRMSEARKATAIPVGASGAGDRTTAALFWRGMQEDDEETECSPIKTFCDRQAQEDHLALQGKHILTGGGSRGHGLNRWYDSTIQLVVNSNGVNGLCIEHSSAEGIVIIKMAESALRYERENRKRRLISDPEWQISAKALTWHVAKEGLMLLEKQKATLDELTQDLDLDVLLFNEFGRNFIKKAGFSPDGFVQLALQLAHFKLHGYLVSTYESASLRRFRFGRVDNIRANTKEALEWVKAMIENESKETKVKLLRRAAEKQAIVTQENIAGQGIDNHLCALNVLARKAEQEGEIETLPEIFRDPLWAELMRFPLSTSQVSTSADITNCYLCYGAVVRDGYGCSYNLQNDTMIFAPSAFKSNPRTNLVAFKNSIQLALQDMRKLLVN